MRILIAGGSINGLTLAQLLSQSNMVDEVIVVERDEYPDGIAGRKGIYHADHTHALSAGGAKLYEEIFPDLFDTVRANGGKLVAWGTWDTRVTFKTGELTQDEYIGVSTWSMSRNLFESAIRQQVQKNPKITIVNKVEVVGLITNGIPSMKEVLGLIVKPRYGAELPSFFTEVHSDGTYRVLANHVVLATGAGDRWTKWFDAARIPIPPLEEVDGKLSYFSADFEDVPMSSLLLATGDKDDRAGIIAAIEGGVFRATIQVHGYAGDYPYTQADFVRLFATCSEEGAAYLAKGTMVSDHVNIFANCANRRYKLWEADNWPMNLTMLGDIWLRMSPQYGQGLTIGVMQVKMLAESLLSGELSAFYNQKLEDLVSFSWGLATGGDQSYLRWANDPSAPPLNLAGRFGAYYFSVLLDLAGANVNVASAFFKVSNYVARPTALMHPKILLAAFAEIGKRLLRRLAPSQTRPG